VRSFHSHWLINVSKVDLLFASVITLITPDFQKPLSFTFNPTSAGVMFVSVFYTAEYAGGLFLLCHICVTDIQERLNLT
jgi:hypothetical protein